MIRVRVRRVWTEDATNSALEVFESDRISRLVDHEPDAVLRVDRADEEVTRLCDLDVLAEPDAECERVAVEVRQEPSERASRGVGLDRAATD